MADGDAFDIVVKLVVTLAVGKLVNCVVDDSDSLVDGIIIVDDVRASPVDVSRVERNAVVAEIDDIVALADVVVVDSSCADVIGIGCNASVVMGVGCGDGCGVGCGVGGGVG